MDNPLDTTPDPGIARFGNAPAAGQALSAPLSERNGSTGARVPGAQGPAAAACLSALLYVPVGIWALASHPVTAAAIGRAATAGVLCSAVPMTADLLALRRVPAGFFGVFMSVNPVFAALTGLVILGQPLQFADWLAITAIVTANAVAAHGQPRAATAQQA